MLHPAELLNFAGLAVWGAVLGALTAIAIYVFIKKISFWQLGDILAPGAIMAQAIGRVGCLINGCCYGDVCDLPIAVLYSNPNSYAPQGLPIYPTEPYAPDMEPDRIRHFVVVAQKNEARRPAIHALYHRLRRW